MVTIYVHISIVPAEYMSRPVGREILRNEAGVEYGEKFILAPAPDDELVELRPAAEDCTCDGCRGLRDVWAQVIWA